MTTDANRLARTTLPVTADATHAPRSVADRLYRYFVSKSAAHADATHAFFDATSTYYSDATLGWVWDSNAKLRAVWDEYMPGWSEDAHSYFTRVVGDERGAIVHMTDTAELFGSEIRALALVDFSEAGITRWVDYWDGRFWPEASVAQMRTPDGQFPKEFGESRIKSSASPELEKVADALHIALRSGDFDTVAGLFSYDGELEDMALRTTLRGRSAIKRWLDRAGRELPWVTGAERVHTVGGAMGGGYEWRSTGAVTHGVVSIELDAEGRIEALRSMWDSSRLERSNLDQLTRAASDRW